MESQSNKRAIAALVLGIVSFLGLCSPILGIICGIIAIILGILVAHSDMPDKRATAGMICGIIGLVLGIAMWIIGMVMSYQSL